MSFIAEEWDFFDKMCENAVKSCRGKLVFVPYNYRVIKEYHKGRYDDIVCPFGLKEYSKFDIPERNKWLVDICDIVMCYVNKEGGAKHTMEYALKKNKIVINLYNEEITENFLKNY